MSEFSSSPPQVGDKVTLLPRWEKDRPVWTFRTEHESLVVDGPDHNDYYTCRTLVPNPHRATGNPAADEWCAKASDLRVIARASYQAVPR